MVELIQPFDVPHVFISITTPGDPKAAKLPQSDSTLGILRLSFHDLDQVNADILKSLEEEENLHVVLFGPNEGDTVVNFMDDHKDKAQALIVHCDAGVSRSPATAAAIAKMFCGEDDSYYFKRYHPNMRVYRGILDAYMRKHP